MSTSAFDGPIQSVDPEALKRVWAFLEDLHATLKTRPTSADEPRGKPGIDVRVFAHLGGPSDDPKALGLRNTLLQFMDRTGILNPWKHEGRFADPVFQLAASWTLPNIGQFDPEKFVRELEKLTKSRAGE